MNIYTPFLEEMLQYLDVEPMKVMTAATATIMLCGAGYVVDHMRKSRKFLACSKEDSTDKLYLSFLRKSLYDLNASRVLVFKFHNGDEDMPHFDNYSRMSCLYEVTAPGFKQLKFLYQNLPLTAYAWNADKIFGPGKYYVTNIEDLKGEDRSTYEVCLKNRVRCYAVHALKNSEDKIIGMLITEFNRPVKFSKSFKIDLDIIADHAGTLLESKLKNEKKS